LSGYKLERDGAGKAYVDVPLRGKDLLCNPLYNKGSCFTVEERQRFGLEGLLPPTVSPFPLQLERVRANILRKPDPLEQYIGLAALQDRNEVLFYRLVLDHIEAFAPIVYTPTVGRACQMFSHIFRRGRGVWITPGDRGRVATILKNGAAGDVRLIVATDNERILGLGDQGAGGMGIPIGKLVLYTVGAGIHPAEVLPVSLDVGTDNAELLDDPLYLGWREPRLRGEAYDALVEEFVAAVQAVFPRALLQWEDFKKGTAFTLLDRYRERLLSFNDDIQGTAAVALAGAMAASRASGVSMRDQRFLIAGAGAAGVGIGRLVRDALAREGLEGADLYRGVMVTDSTGPLVEGHVIHEDYKRELVWPAALTKELGIGATDSLEVLVDKLHPTVLVGTTGQTGVFNEALVRSMGSHVERPAIFPFSNPTSKSEAVPADLVRWTDGRVLVATGSPFEPVVHGDKRFRIGQGNNVFIFPGIGLGALLSNARRVTESMFTVAAHTLADFVDEGDLAEGALYPPLSELRMVSAAIAAEVAVEAGRAGVAPELTLDRARELVAAAMWDPAYPELRSV